MFPSLYVAGASWHVVMVLIFFVDGLWVRHAREQGVSNTLLGDQRVRGRRETAQASTPPLNCRCYVAARWQRRNWRARWKLFGCGFQGEIDVSGVGRAEIACLDPYISRLRKSTLA